MSPCRGRPLPARMPLGRGPPRIRKNRADEKSYTMWPRGICMRQTGRGTARGGGRPAQAREASRDHPTPAGGRRGPGANADSRDDLRHREDPDLEAGLIKLIDRYRGLSQAKLDAMTEQETGTKLILPLLRSLGWDTESVDEVREQHRTAYGPSDYELLINGMPRIVVEIKRISNSLDGYHVARGKKVPYPKQAIQYAWNLRVDWVVLTNFKELRLYHSLSKTPEDGLVFSMTANDMVHRLDDLALLARDSVLAGRLDVMNLRRERSTVDVQVIDDLNVMRRDIHEDILRNNEGVGAGDDLRMMVQTLMDRLLVIRVAEDRGLIAADTLRNEMDAWRRHGLDTSFARRLRVLFAEFEDIYDTALFKTGAIDKVALSNSLLTGAVDRLYGYDFALINSDVLGSIYEDYLTTSLRSVGHGKIQVIDDNKERKKLGIFYTPPHLVSHTLDKTLGEKLAECRTPDDVSKIRVLDPSCGSGSFLIKAFDLFLDWYKKYNRAASKKIAAAARGEAGKKPGNSNGTLDGDLALVADPERRIVRDNLFGIDIDPQAASIASVNLMLKAMTKNEKLDRILGTNILVGNSLVTGLEDGFRGLDPADRAALGPLDPARLPHDRFDVIVGNPPYYTVGSDNPIRVSASFEAVRSGGAVNAAMMFVERAIGLLDGDGGRLGLVIPKMCSYAKGWSGTRKLLSDPVTLTHVVDCMEAFKDVNLEQVIMIGKKSASPAGGNGGTCRIQRAWRGTVQDGEDVRLSAFADADMIFLESDPASWSIREKMLAAGRPLGDLLRGGTITTGEYAQGHDCWLASRPKNGRRMLAGDDIARYRIAASRYYRHDEPLMAAKGGSKAEAVQAPHVVGQRIVAHLGSPRPHIALAFAFDEEGSRAFDTVTHVLPGKVIDAHALVAMLNSRPVSWYAHKFVFCNAVRSMDLRPWYMKKIVVPAVGPGAEKELADLERTIARLALSDRSKRPRMGDYLVEGEKGTLELREYVRAAGGSERKIHCRGAEGKVSRVEAVDAGGGWLDFFARYSPQRGRAPRRDRILSLRVPDRGVRDYIRVRAGGDRHGGRGGRAGPLYEQVAGTRIPAYGRGFAENLRALQSMLAPYARDTERFEAWSEEYAAVDAAIDRVVCRAFGLSRDEARHIGESSRPPGWSNY